MLSKFKLSASFVSGLFWRIFQYWRYRLSFFVFRTTFVPMMERANLVYIPFISVDPNDCEHWANYDGTEEYMTLHLACYSRQFVTHRILAVWENKTIFQD
tara:strand:- start:325 stop:624 length:300 start_codon:yes stop_codon:yes gene_type:complete